MHTGVTASKVQLEAAVAEQIDAMMLGDAEGIQMAAEYSVVTLLSPAGRIQAMHVWRLTQTIRFYVCAHKHETRVWRVQYLQATVLIAKQTPRICTRDEVSGGGGGTAEHSRWSFLA